MLPFRLYSKINNPRPTATSLAAIATIKKQTFVLLNPREILKLPPVRY